MKKVCAMTTVLLLLVGTAGNVCAQIPEAKPGPEQEHFKQFEGTWDATIMYAGNESKGTMVWKIGLGGMWLMEHFKGGFGDLTFEGVGALGYDSMKKKYVGVWIDSMGGSPLVTEGTYDKEKKTMTMSGMMPTPDGKSTKITTTTVMTDPNTVVFTMVGSGPDGKEGEMMKITYKRQAK